MHTIPLLLAVLPGLAFAASGEPRYLTKPEDVKPILQQFTRNPFRHPGVWSSQAKDPFEADLKAMIVAKEPADPKPPAPVNPNIGGIQRPDELFLQKVKPLAARDAAPKSTRLPPSSTEMASAAATQNFDSPSAGEGTVASSSEPRYLRPYLLVTASFMAQVRGRARIYPGECSMRYRTSNESEVLQTFEEIELETGTDRGVKDGDLFRIYEVGDEYNAYTSAKYLGRLVRVNGIAEILRAGPKYSVARLVRCFGTVSRNSRAAPIGDVPAVRTTGYSPSQGPMRVGRIIWVSPPHQLPQPFSIVIMDEGTDKGFQVGDFVYLFNRRNGRMTDKVLGNAVVLRTDARSSTLLLQDVEPGVIDPGDFVVAHLSANH